MIGNDKFLEIIPETIPVKAVIMMQPRINRIQLNRAKVWLLYFYVKCI